MISEEAILAAFIKSLNLKKSETCLVVTDTGLQDLAKPFFLYASKHCRKAYLEVMQILENNGSEPKEDVAKLMKGFDVILLITSKSMTHTKARRDATKEGARIASMPGLTEDMANRCLDVDYSDMQKKGGKLRDMIVKCKRIRIVTKKGTDITLERGDAIPHNSCGLIQKKSEYGNLPAGEVDFSPESASGIMVFDGSFPLFGRLEKPIRLEVKKGSVNGISGWKAKELKGFLDGFGPKAYIVAELGIGTNPQASITGKVLEDEKVLGTCHIALGNNISYGRGNDVKMHMDGVITKPTIFLDDKKIMEEGNILF